MAAEVKLPDAISPRLPQRRRKNGSGTGSASLPAGVEVFDDLVEAAVLLLWKVL